MELRDIRYFAMVAEHQNIGRAAEALDLSATALTKSLRRLEKSVGAKLVQRAAKGVALTAVGTALLNRINPLQGTMADVRREAADLARGDAGHITVGTLNGYCECVMAAACAALSRQSPAITLNVIISTDAFLTAAMRKGEVDFCISTPGRIPTAEFVFEPQFEMPNVIFASASHRLAKRRRLTIPDLAGERWAVLRSSTYQLSAVFLPWQGLHRLFEKHGLPPPTVGMETNSQEARLAAVAYADHLGFVSRQFLLQAKRRYPLVELPIAEEIYLDNLCLVYRKNAYLSPAARRLIDLVKVQVREMAGPPRSPRRVG
jgi:DNA-binding transcriptional LysR family regulator